jgi:hypothetical protein
MTEYDDSLLAVRFAALAPEPLPGDWADVLRRAGAARKSSARTGRFDALQGRRRFLFVLALIALVAVVSASAFAAAHTLFAVEVKPFAHGELNRTVDGVRFSLNVSKTGWENGPAERVRSGNDPEFRTHSLLISKSTVGGQRAEAVIFWTTFPAGGEAAPCSAVVNPAIGGSTAALARAMARAPGTKLVKGPTRVTIGGRPATRVVLSVREDLGCDPGFFFTWPHDWDAFGWGAFWLDTNVGDTMSLWIVDVDGRRLVIEAEVRQPDSQGYPLGFQVTRADVLKVEAEIETIVESIRFARR